LRAGGPDEFYTGSLATHSVDYLRRYESYLDTDDFAAFQPEVADPLSVMYGSLQVLTSPPNTHGFVLLRALRALDELGVADPLGTGLGQLMRIFHHGNRLRHEKLADQRLADVDITALLERGLGDTSPIGSAASGQAVAHGDTVGIAAADDQGYAVSLIQSVFHSFGSGLIDPATGVLFHNRGTSFSLDPASPNVLAPRKRPAHTLMPVLTTDGNAVRHVLATMGGQAQPQILGQVLLRALSGADAQAAVSAPRAAVGAQIDGETVDSVTVEADVPADAAASIGVHGLHLWPVPTHSEALGHTNVVFVDPAGGLVAASDPRADGAASVTHFARRDR